MKKIFPILIVGILVISGLGAFAVEQTTKENIITDNFTISTPKIIEKGDYISIDLADANSNYLEKDKPYLPVVSKIYTFPFGTKIENVDVIFSNIITEKLLKPIEPSPKIEMRLSSCNNNIKRSMEIDYSDLGIYPKEKFSWKTAAGIKGKDHVIYCMVGINPIQYNTKEDTISYVKNVELRIKYTPPDVPINFPDEYDLLILTPTEFESTLQRFVVHKEGRNIRTKLVTLDEIPSQGADIQESIKYFIKDAIETWGVDYLILVGSGVEGHEKFPFRKAWMASPPHEDYFGSDLYYADIYNSSMEFADWDFDDDGKYAEYPRDIPNIDVNPDIHLGRIPCNSTSELETYIDKVIWYDEHNKMTKKIVQIGGDTVTDDSQGINEGEYTNTVVLSKLPGYQTTKLWASLNTLTKPKIANGFIRTLADFVDFSGHGSPKSFATHPTKDESRWIPDPTLKQFYGGWDTRSFDIYSVTNPNKYPIVFYNTCSNNKFIETDECLSWKTLKLPEGGGIIAFGAAGIAYGGDGTEDAERAFGWFEVNTHEELFNTKNLGETWSNSVSGYYATFQSSLDNEDYITLLEYSMFGDPTLNAEDGDDPKIRTKSISYSNIYELLLSFFPRLETLIKIFKDSLN